MFRRHSCWRAAAAAVCAPPAWRRLRGGPLRLTAGATCTVRLPANPGHSSCSAQRLPAVCLLRWCPCLVRVPGPCLTAPHRPSPPPAGRYVTVTATGPLGTALSLCSVQLLGAEDLPLSQHMRPRRKAQPRQDGAAALLVTPAALQPGATLPVDGSSGSCLQAPAGGGGRASWQLNLDGSYPVLAVRLTATAAAARPDGSGGKAAQPSKLAVSLLDAGGAAVASWRMPASSQNRSSSSSGGSGNGDSGALLELPAAVHVAAVRVEGFASLCEAQMLAASHRKTNSYQLAPLQPPAGTASGSSGSNGSASNSATSTGAAGEWRVLDAASGSPLDPSLSTALLDGDPTTCATLQPWASLSGLGARRPAALELQLDRPVR